MPAHSRPKDGVASLAYVAGIHVFRHGIKARRGGPGLRPPKDINCTLLPRALRPAGGTSPAMTRRGRGPKSKRPGEGPAVMRKRVLAYFRASLRRSRTT